MSSMLLCKFLLFTLFSASFLSFTNASLESNLFKKKNNAWFYSTKTKTKAASSLVKFVLLQNKKSLFL